MKKYIVESYCRIETVYNTKKEAETSFKWKKDMEKEGLYKDTKIIELSSK